MSSNSIYRHSMIGDDDDLAPEFESAETVDLSGPAPAAPLLGQQGNYVYSDLEEADSGPYHFWSPGEVITLADMYMGFPRIEPCVIQTIEDQKIWCDKRYLDHVTGQQRASIDPETRRPEGFVEAQYTIHASANRSTLLNSYGKGGPSNRGLIEITAFAKLEPRRVGLAQFNRKLQPQPVLFGEVPEDLQKEVETSGALTVRERFVREAREFFSSPEFVGQASVKLQRLYLGAIDEILQAFGSYRRLATAYMEAQDNALELPDSNDKSKDQYDDRDYILMWLLARQPVKIAQARMIAAASGGGGLTAEQLQTILQSVHVPGGLTPELIASIASQAAAATVIALRSQESGPAKPPQESKATMGQKRAARPKG